MSSLDASWVLWDEQATTWDEPVTQHTDRARQGRLTQHEDPLRIVNTQPWMEHAVCSTVDPDLWFADLREAESRNALAICFTCPVLSQCRDYALALVRGGERLLGVWGGTTPQQRARLTGTPLPR